MRKGGALRRVVADLLVVGLAVVALAACGNDSGAGSSVRSLQGALLTVEDMPPGYAITTAYNPADRRYCTGQDPIGDMPADQKAEVMFERSTAGPFVHEVLAIYADDETALRIMSQARELIALCRSWTENDGNEVRVHTADPLSFTQFGDETLAVRVNRQGLNPVSGDVIYVRKGKIVMSLSHLGLPQYNTDETAGFVEKAFGRI